MDVARCETCGHSMQDYKLPLGRIGFACVPCERVKAGRCASCAAPRMGDSRLCTTCWTVQQRARDLAWHQEQRAIEQSRRRTHVVVTTEDRRARMLNHSRTVALKRAALREAAA